jgi:hypothetical protein
VHADETLTAFLELDSNRRRLAHALWFMDVEGLANMCHEITSRRFRKQIKVEERL